MLKYAKTNIFALSLLYLSLYIPVAAMTYFPCWYKFNCGFHQRCNFIGLEKSYRHIEELTLYFRHSGELNSGWSTREKKHLDDVRKLLDTGEKNEL